MTSEVLDLRQVVKEIHSRIRSEPQPSAEPAPARGAPALRGGASLESLRKAYAYLQHIRKLPAARRCLSIRARPKRSRTG